MDNTFAQKATTARTLTNIREALAARLRESYNITDSAIVDDFLKIHGLHKSQFDYVAQIENILNSRINDVSIDDNSNKSEKTIEAVHQEAFSSTKKAIGYDMLYREMKRLYGREEATRLSGEMYDYTLALADSTNILKVYCYAVDASKLVTEGRPFGQLKSGPKQRVSSYVSALCETIHQLASELAGAVAIGSFFLDITHLLIYKENTSFESIRFNSQIRKQIENEFQQFVHSVNHLSRNSNESPFTNISVFDRVKLKALVADDNMGWYFPSPSAEVPSDIDRDRWLDYIVDYIYEIQKIFIEFFDKGDPLSNGMPYRFPVLTVNFSKEEEGADVLDQGFLDYISKKDIYRYNIFASEGTKTASCCFKGDETIKVEDNGTLKLITLKEFVDSKCTSEELEDFLVEKKLEPSTQIESLNPRTLERELTPITGVLKKINNSKKLYRVRVGDREVAVTGDHIFLVKNKTTGELVEMPMGQLKEEFANYQLPVLSCM